MRLSRLQGLRFAAFLLAAASVTEVTATELTVALTYDAQSPCTGSTTAAPVLARATPAACTPAACGSVFATTLYPKTVCSNTDATATGTFIATMLPNLFGSSPYVVVEKHITGTCDADDIESITAYLADGKCHKTGASASYRATRVAADPSAVITTYTTADCDITVNDAATNPTNGKLTTTITSAMGSAACSSINLFGAANQNVKIYGVGETLRNLKTLVTYSTNTGACAAPVVPTKLETTLVGPAGCTAATGCTASGSVFTSITCAADTTALKTNMDTVFGTTNPYVIVQEYTAGQSCFSTELTAATVYAADGGCHDTSASTSYRATRASDGSAVITKYTAAAGCTGASTTIDITAAQSSGATCVTNMKFSGGGGATPVKLNLNGNFDAISSGSCSSATQFWVATSDIVQTGGSCSAAANSAVCTAGAAGAAVPYTLTTCSSVANYKSAVTTAFADKPYVIMEKYTPGKSCDGTKLASIAAYVADGKCHATGATATSYKATKGTDGSVLVKTYTDKACSAGAVTVLDATSSQASNSNCADGANGIADVKITVGSPSTPFYLQSTATFDTKTGNCLSPTMPTQLVTSPVGPDGCSPTQCVGTTAPYSSTWCSTVATYAADVSTVYGSSPFVIVEKYLPGKACGAAYLSGMTTYLADGLCHQTGAASSYRASRSSVDSSVSVKTFMDAKCSSLASSLSVTGTQSQATSGTSTCVTGIFDAKVYGAGTTPLYLQAVVNYDTSTSKCQNSAVPPSLVAFSVKSTDSCTATTACSGAAAPFTGTTCSTVATYKTDMANAFGSYPFVIVEKYVGGTSCASNQLSNITVYLADGLCHVTGAASSYKAVTKASDGSVLITAYTDATCTTAVTTPVLTATSAQVSTLLTANGGTCAATTGVLDTKVYAIGSTPLYLTATVNYDTNTGNCQNPSVPSQYVVSAASDVATYTCTPTTTCSGTAAPYSSTSCSSTVSYKADLATAFGSNPYVIVERYAASSSCAAAQLASITAYFADGKCHVTGAAASYKASKGALDGVVTVTTYSDATCTTATAGASAVSITATAAQIATPTCGAPVANAKVFAFGTTSQFITWNVKYDPTVSTGSTTGCTLPTKVAATLSSMDTCVAAATCTTGTVKSTTACGTLSNYKQDLATIFTTNPYVVVESYTAGQACAASQITDVTAYLADGSCHQIDTSLWYKGMMGSDGSVLINTYATTGCAGAATSVVDATGTQVTSNLCDANNVNGIANKKVYTFNTAPSLSLVLSGNYNEGTCLSSSITMLKATLGSTAASAGTCTAVGSSNSDVAATKTTATATFPTAYRTAISALFPSSNPPPYVVVETYDSGVSCAAVHLNDITVYLADKACHRSSTSSGSYKANLGTDSSVQINTYTSNDCTGAATSVVDATGTQVTANLCDANGIANKKVYQFNAPTTTNLVLSGNYNEGTCLSSSITMLKAALGSTAANAGTCTAVGSSNADVAATKTTATVTFPTAYRTAISALFPSTNPPPYVVVETYDSGMSCAAVHLNDITVYLADGACHRSSSVSTASYKATIGSDNSVLLKTYSDGSCTFGVATIVDASTSQVSGNTCDASTTGIVDKKVYTSGQTTVNVNLVGNFAAVDCSASTATQLVANILGTTTCTSVACAAGTGVPYTGTYCSTQSTYKADAGNYLGSANPYVLVELYTAGRSCATTGLLGMVGYLADGNCYASGTSLSYKAARAADNSATIRIYSDTLCRTSFMTLTASGDQGTSNTCMTGISDTKISGNSYTPYYLQSTVNYATVTSGACSSPQQLLTRVVGAGECTTVACSTASAPYVGTTCSTVSSYKADVTTTLGATNPFVIVEKYLGGKSCAATALTGMTAYLADGLCHQVGTSASYQVSRAADNSAKVQTFMDAKCTALGTSLSVSATQGGTTTATSTCVTGVFDAKVYGSGTTPLFVQSVLNYDSKANNCASPGVPSQATVTVNTVQNCTATTTCSGSAAPYTVTTCNTVAAYKSELATAFGSNPYVLVEKYVAGKTCAAAQLSSITAYLADGKCHPTGASSSYKAVTKASDGSVLINTYTDAACTTSETAVLTVTAAQVTGNSCATGTTGVVDTKVFTFGTTPLYLKAAVNFDTNTGNCQSPAVPSQYVAAIVNTTCTPTTTCSGTAAPYSSTSCSSALSYKTDLAAAFGSYPYVIVENYVASKSCAAAQLSGITAYLADGKCHPTGTASSYKAVTQASDGSVLINTYTDAACTTEAVAALSATAAQITGNSCATGATGILDTKIYALGITPLSLKSTVNFDTSTGNCQSPTAVPSQLVTTLLTDTCTPTTTCTGTAAPYSGTTCSSTLSYKTDLATAFGSNPYVAVEKYVTGKSCAAAQLSGITTYLADGKCHLSSATASYKATRAADGSAVVKTYTDVACTTGEAVAWDVTAAQVAGNTCVTDTKVYGGGQTPVNLKLNGNFDATACTSPTQFSVATADMLGVANCTAVACAAGASATNVPFTSTACSTLATYKADVNTTFGSKPYAIVEKYTAGKSCDGTKLTSITAYLADGKCHATAAAASYRASRGADGVLNVKTYTDKACGAGEAVVVSATAAQITGNSCAAGTTGIVDMKLYVNGTTPTYFQSAVKFDTSTGGCTSPVVPTQLVTTVATTGDACTATTACATGATAAPYTSTSCSTSLTYKTDVATAFGSSPYVIVESYTDGTTCAASALTGVMTYLADGWCHRTDAAASFVATKAVDGSVVIKTYTDASCSTGEVAMSFSAAQTTGNPCTGTAGIPNKKIFTSTKSSQVYSSAALYDSNVGDCKSPPVLPTRLVSTLVDTCTPTTTCGGSGPYTGTLCNPIPSYRSDIATLFGANTPYVIVEKYTAGASCAIGQITGITVYLADGKCRTDGSVYFKATKNADTGAVLIKTYSDATCATAADTILDATAAQITANTCAATTGVLDTKVYTSAANVGTPIYLTATVSYDTSTGNCQSPAVPSQVVASPVAAGASCTATTTCTAGVTTAPFTSTMCSSALTYKADLANAFGSQPYIIVEKYTAGQSCSASKLTGATAYLLDAKCHKTTAATASYYKATRGADGSVTVKTYSDSACATVAAAVLDAVTAAQITANTCVAPTGVADTYLYLYGGLQSTVNFDTATGNCQSPAIPTHIVSSMLTVNPCTATTSCSGGAAPYSSTLCTSTSAHKTDAATAFGTNPYVIVEKYSGTTCAAAQLTGVTTYIADGKCHQASALTSFIATRSASGRAVVRTFTDPACTAGETIVAFVTAAQAAANTCVAGSSATTDTKVSGNGATPLYLASTVNYDTKTGDCKSPVVPTQLLTGVVSADSCTATSTCSGTAVPFTGTSCSSSLTYSKDVATAFASNPYVVVESYSAAYCGNGELSGAMAYLSDGKCHVTGATASYKATKSADGTVTVRTYSNSTCGPLLMTVVVPGAQVASSSCVPGVSDMKVYGDGVSPTVWSAVVVSDDKVCATPSQLAITSGYSCDAASCVVLGDRSLSRSCADDYFALAKSTFTTKPYVVADIYKNGTSCGTKQGAMVYLADTKCHVAMDGASSFTVTLASDGSGTLVMYSDLKCSTGPTTIALTKAQLSTSQSTSPACTENTKYYGFNFPTTAAPAPTTTVPTTAAPTSAPTTAAPTSAPTPTTTTSTSSGKSAATSLSPRSTLLAVLLASLGWMAAFLL